MNALRPWVLLSFSGLLAASAWASLGDLKEPALLAPYAASFACSASTLRALAWVRLVLAPMVLWPRATRAALAASGMLALFTLFANTLDFHNNRYALALYALWGAVAFGQHSTQRIGLQLLRAQCSFIYLVSAGTKLLDADWAGGAVLRARFLWFDELARARGVPQGILSALQDARVSQAISLGAIATEGFLAAALWFSRTRRTATFVGLAFHGLIQLTAKVETFSWLTLTVYAAFWMHGSDEPAPTTSATRDS